MKIKFLQKQKVVLDINKTISGNIIINDSPDYEIMINPKNRKIITFPKGTFSDGNENDQLEFFNFLRRQSAIKHDSVQGGYVFGSYDALYPEGEEENSLNYLLYCISEFFKVKLPELKKKQDYLEKRKQFIYEPDDENSTDLGDVPHEERKGSIHHDLRQNYSYSYFLYEGKQEMEIKVRQKDLQRIIREEYEKAKKMGLTLKDNDGLTRLDETVQDFKIKQEKLQRIILEEYEKAKKMGLTLKAVSNQEKKIDKEKLHKVIKEDMGLKDKGDLGLRELSKEELVKSTRVGNKYKVKNKEQIKNLGQLMYYLSEKDGTIKQTLIKLVNKVYHERSDKFKLGFKLGVSALLGIATGKLTNDPKLGATVASLIGTGISEAILLGTPKLLEKFQIDDNQRGTAPIYRLFDLHDHLGDLIEGAIKDKAMRGVVRKRVLEKVQEKMEKEKDTWADILIVDFIKETSAAKEQWEYAAQKYGIHKWKKTNNPNAAFINAPKNTGKKK